MIKFGRLEEKFGWLAFPGFLRYYAMIHVLVFVLQLLQPELGAVLGFDRGKILSGEVWRLATGFFASPQVGRPSAMSLVFLLCVVNFAYMLSDGLEGAWGVFKASLFYYTGMLTMMAANFIYGIPVFAAPFCFYGAAFLAFAVIYPKVEILMFFIIPVRVRVLGIITGVGIGLTIVMSPLVAPYFLLAFANFILWAGIPALRGTAQVVAAVQRKKKFDAASVPAGEAFHTCAVCGRTELTHDHLDFRIGLDEREYCVEHLPE